MTRTSISRPGGFTLLEVLIFGAITCLALFCITPLLTKTFQMQQRMTSGEIPPEAAHAMDLFVNDVKEAVPGSTAWDVLTSTMPLTFSKGRLTPDSGKYEATLLTYGYEGPEKGPGAFVRVEGSSSTILLSSIDAPTEAAPIFQYDPSLHLIMIDIRYHAVGKPPIRLVRRVALSQ
jgi:hypothetical protein